MEFNSKELKNAIEIESSITYVKPQIIDIDYLKDNLKILIISKNQNLLKPFEFAQMVKSNSSSGMDTLKVLLNILRDYVSMKFRDDNIKSVTIRKNIDIMCLAIEASLLNGIDISPNEMHSIFLGFLSKNFV